MLHYLLQLHKHNIPMFSLRWKKPLDLLSVFSTCTNRSMRFFKNAMLSTSSAMNNTRCCTSFRWETRPSYICIKRTLHNPIRRSSHFSMGLTISPRLWIEMILSSILHPYLAHCTQCSMWTSFDHIFHHYWTPQRSQKN
jgi:hypothetical protein